MQRPQICLVHGTHALILRVSRYAGLAPLRFERHARGWVVSLSKGWRLYSYFLITALILNTVLAIIQDLKIYMEYSVHMSSNFGRSVAVFDMMIIISIAGVGIYGAPARMRNTLRYVSILTEVDEQLDLRPGPLADTKLVLFGWTFLCYLSIYIFVDYSHEVHESSEFEYVVAYQFIGLYILYLTTAVLALQFSFTTLTVLARFRALNDALEQTAQEVNDIISVEESKIPRAARHQNTNLIKVNSLTNLTDPVLILRHYIGGSSRLTVSPSEAVRRVTALYHKLCDVVHLLDVSYGLPLFIILFSTLLNFVVSTYYLIIELAKNPYHAVVPWCWCVNHTIRMFIVVEPGYRTKTEIHRTANILSRLATSVHDQSLSGQVELFSRQLFLRSASYSPMGICVLDRSLMASMIGAVTTYLVILIQFQANSA